MRTVFFTFLSVLFFFFSFAQSPETKWEKYITNTANANQVLFDAKPTKDKGYIVAGVDNGSGFSETTKTTILNKDLYGKPWLVKLDSNGNKSWSAIPSSRQGYSYQSVQQTADEGYVAAGYTEQFVLGGGPNGSYDSDFLLSKYSNDGTFLWEKTYGGSYDERAFSIHTAGSNGLVVAGIATSDDGDVVGNHRAAYADVWLLRLDGSGNILWKKCFGGTGSDTAYAIIQTPDKGFLIAGSSNSSNGNLTVNNGGTDAWLIKTDSLGNLLWQKSYGGSGNDAFKSVTLNADGTYTLAGYTLSSTVLGSTGSGEADLWVVKTTLDGDVIWSKLFGGSQDEQAFSVQPMTDGSNLITGYTESSNGTVSQNNGGADAWLLKLSSTGTLVWQKCVGTSNDEVSFAGISLGERDFLMAGYGKPLASTDVDGYVVRLGNANIIKGTLFLDNNSNGVKDSNEPYFSDAIVTSKNGSESVSAVPYNGLFTNYVGIGTYTSTVNVTSPYYTAVPSFKSSTFLSYLNTDSISFALQPIANKQDLRVHLIPLLPAKPGFNTSYRIFYENVGTTTISSGEIMFQKDSRVSLFATVPAVNNVSGNTLQWSYANFKPGDTASIFLDFTVATPPTVNINDTLVHTVFIDPVGSDETPANDTAVLRQLVTGSFDPNDKAERNGGLIRQSFINSGSYLEYTIRFQNTGTEAATFVIVRDTLSSRVDASTLELITVSHPFALTIENGNQLKWTFDNINLPDSNTNEPASHGYIVYRIRPLSDVVAGEVIHNTASIYFDYNLPVLTNDALTQVEANLISLPLRLLSFTGNQRNKTISLAWRATANTALASFEIERSLDGNRFVRIGVRSAFSTISDYHFTDNLPGVSAPIIYYRLKLTEEDESYRYSNVLVFRQGEEGAGDLSISPNPVRKQASLSFTTTQAGKGEIQLLNASGRVISRQQINVIAGKNVCDLIKPSALSTGYYTIRLIIGQEVKTALFIVQ